jgi:hypothetical protein
MRGRLRIAIAIASAALLGAGCRSAIYSAYETVGIHKRDLLKKRVVAARDEQQQAGEDFEDALAKLRALYGSPNTSLEKVYDQLAAEYDQCSSRAEAVRERVRDIETVADDLFDEWEDEIGQISTEVMRRGSREQLRATRARYAKMHSALERAEKSMEPVLTKLRDQVLYLKHNLNAQAIASLRGESASIQEDVARLVADMNRSIERANEFIGQMP